MSTKTEDERRLEEEKQKASSSGQSISEGVAAARAEVRKRAEMKSGVTKPEAPTDLKSMLGKQSLKTILLKLVIGIVLLVFLGYFLLQSLAGNLNVGIEANDESLEGQPVIVNIYNGDVANLLTDSDPSNDPEPADTHTTTIGQRCTFYLHDFGSHTLWAQLEDESVQATCEPHVAVAWGLDFNTTLWFS